MLGQMPGQGVDSGLPLSQKPLQFAQIQQVCDPSATHRAQPQQHGFGLSDGA